MVIATKFGFDFDANGGQGGMNSRPEQIRAVTDQALKRLKTDVIAEDLADIESALATIKVEGDRYPAHLQARVNRSKEKRPPSLTAAS